MLTRTQPDDFRKLQRRVAAGIRPLIHGCRLHTPDDASAVANGWIAVIDPVDFPSAKPAVIELYNDSEHPKLYFRRLAESLKSDERTIWNFVSDEQILTVWQASGRFNCFEKGEIITFPGWPRSVRLTPDDFCRALPKHHRDSKARDTVKANE